MIVCPKGILVRKKEGAELVRALDTAIEERQIEMNSNLPPSYRNYTFEDLQNSRKWKRDMRVWRKLRASLAKGAA